MVDRIILIVFSLQILGMAAITIVAMAWHLLPFFIGVFALLTCLLALWTILFHFGVRK